MSFIYILIFHRSCIILSVYQNEPNYLTEKQRRSIVEVVMIMTGLYLTVFKVLASVNVIKSSFICD